MIAIPRATPPTSQRLLSRNHLRTFSPCSCSSSSSIAIWQCRAGAGTGWRHPRACAVVGLRAARGLQGLSAARGRGPPPCLIPSFGNGGEGSVRGYLKARDVRSAVGRQILNGAADAHLDLAGVADDEAGGRARL